MSAAHLIFGAATVHTGGKFSQEQLPELFEVLLAGGCKKLDTAVLYLDSEVLLGKANAGSKFDIDTKITGGFGGGASADAVIREGIQSRQNLGCTIDVLYIHGPDRSVPFQETLNAVNELHKQNVFRRFGLSNFSVEEVKAVCEICKAQGYVRPVVYQGNYNAFARHHEAGLFDLLRQEDMAFYAYSPVAGGFLTKTVADVEAGSGNFDPNTPIGVMYRKMYYKPAIMEALAEWDDIANKEGCTRSALAYRWVMYSSFLNGERGDSIIMGAKSAEQAETTIKNIRHGPISSESARRVDEIWKKVSEVAPLDNFHSGL